ncbi:uncharacterized protein LOC109507055 [Hippocampus comes]|uniref:uncharacterized protein LOC109507055 n=1 Tax=Hippocampus comes TaxID=109280 RepID=UPI00094F10AF|nr:PREDICTED: uncharacterized protein LOC109507055 [Hippocampus comes]XP_019711764.1 PREDICTED: uncharacterized protein LOC109507055 [Hippocampus comes]
MSAENCCSKQAATMDDFWSTQEFSNRHPHHLQRPSFHPFPAVDSPQDFPQQFASQEKNHVTSFFSARRSATAFDWFESGEKERSCDDAEAGFYNNGNWDVNSAQNFNPALSKWRQSIGEFQNWDLGSSGETPSPLSEVSWCQSTPLSQIVLPQTLPSLNPPQVPATQKPDAVLETVPHRSILESHWPVWGAKGEHFGSEKLFNPNTCLSAAPPFPFSHLESSVLSPPLTPLPAPSHSPAMTCSQSHSQGGDDNWPLHFFVSNPQPLPSRNSSGMMWTLPAGSDGTAQGNLTASHNIREQLLSLGKSSLKSRRNPSHAAPSQATGSVSSHWKAQTYTGTPFPSLLHSSQERRAHYTPRPLLNPAREGTGLYSSFSSIQPREKDPPAAEAMINIGSDFQAEVPALSFGESGEKLSREQSLWKSCEAITESRKIQEQVEKLLLLSSSSCFPGGGSNIELALHSLHACQTNIMAALEMLLLTGTSPTEDYHYAGSDVWTESEKRTFNEALKTHGKNFSLIHKKVKTKTVNQCVEFYYLVNKSQAKRHKYTKLKSHDEKGGESERHKITLVDIAASPPAEKQSGPEEVCPGLPLAGSFPCTKCGKMFNKVKSRNAHMKVHRKFSKAWRNNLLVQHLTPAVDSSIDDFYRQSSHSVSPELFACHSGSLPVTSTFTGDPNFYVSTVVDADDSKPKEPPHASVFNQSWHSFAEFQMESYVP